MTFKYVFLGLSISSSKAHWHATTYRGLLKYLAARGHEVTFLERDLPLFGRHRDLACPRGVRTHLYGSFEELNDRFSADVREADLVVVGSYLLDGVHVGEWALELAPWRTVFYDMDTPVTLEKLASGDADYVTREQIARYAMYLSFTGGPTLAVLEKRVGSPCARALYCAVDPELYYPDERALTWDLGYVGTYSTDRQAALERLLVDPARRWPDGRFVVAGELYPSRMVWPSNVERIGKPAPYADRELYNGQRFTLNLTRARMIAAGWSPSARLFDAAACGATIITDPWPGLEGLFAPGREILVADTSANVDAFIRHLPEEERIAVGERARRRTLAEHTSMHRAETFEQYTREILERLARHSRANRPPLASTARPRARATRRVRAGEA